MGKKKALK